jgi:hypothetical protein
MKRLSDQDWEQVNAWADGELPQADAEAFSRRLNAEPTLGEALESVRQVTSSLSVLRPEPGRPARGASANTNRAVRGWVAGASLAAALALVAVLFWSGGDPRAIDVHRSYAAQTFQLDARPELRNASETVVDGFPLLRDANLYLVTTDVQADKASAHYVGVNGCRLTILRGAYAPAQVSSDVQARQWVAGQARYQVIATGMDAAKFSSAATYLEQVTQNRLEESTVMALRDAVQSATNCRLDLS